MKRLLLFLLLSIACLAQTADKDKIWSLEDDYWRYVQAGDMVKYRTLWHPKFVGWPSSSPQPARKDHITDWYDNYVKQGVKLKAWELEPLEFEQTGSIAVTHYRIHYLWVDKNGQGEPTTLRVMHTWLRVGEGWQIISGMSAPTDANGK